MSQNQIARLAEDFIKHFDQYLSWHGMRKMPFGTPDNGYRRQSLKMDARDHVKQSGPLLAEALAKNHPAESEGVYKMIFYIAEGGGPDHAYAIWPDLRARLRRIAVDAPERTEFTPSPEDLNILTTLAKSRKTMILTEISVNAGHALNVVKERISVLEDAGLSERPHGERKGRAITSAGRELLSSHNGNR